MTPTTPPADPFEQLRRARQGSGESVEALAARAGVDPAWLAQVEGGTSPDDSSALGLVGQALNLDLGAIFGRAPRRRTSTTSSRKRTSTPHSSSRAGSGDLDRAVRAAVRAELAPLERALRDLADEVERLRRAQEETAVRVGRLAPARGGAKAAARASKAPGKGRRP